MINVANLPAVRAQLEQDAAAAKEEPELREPGATVEYARAPDGPGIHAAAGRPPAVQRNAR